MSLCILYLLSITEWNIHTPSWYDGALFWSSPFTLSIMSRITSDLYDRGRGYYGSTPGCNIYNLHHLSLRFSTSTRLSWKSVLNSCILHIHRWLIMLLQSCKYIMEWRDVWSAGLWFNKMAIGDLWSTEEIFFFTNQLLNNCKRCSSLHVYRIQFSFICSINLRRWGVL